MSNSSTVIEKYPYFLYLIQDFEKYYGSSYICIALTLLIGKEYR